MNHGLPGWEDLYHGGLLLDTARLHTLSQNLPPPLDDYADLLTDNFTRRLSGKDRYMTILFEIRARKVLYDDAYWTLVADLRNDDLLDQNGHGELLDKLHARQLLDDLEYSRRRGRNESTAKDEQLPQVAEQESAYDAEHKQKDLFDEITGFHTGSQ